MQFKAKTEEEVRKIFEKGEYNFKVISATEKNSSKGKPMIELNLEIYHGTIKGKTNFVKCFLLGDEPNFEFLIRHFCFSVGMSKDYESGKLVASTLIGKTGKALIGIEVDKAGKYPDKNRVIDFIEKSSPNQHSSNVGPQESPVAGHETNDIDDDIPF